MIFKEKGKRKKGRKQKQNTYESAYIITKRYYNIILFFTFTIDGSFQTKSDTLTRFTRICKIIWLARIWPTYIARGEFCMLINMYLAFSFFFFFLILLFAMITLLQLSIYIYVQMFCESYVINRKVNKAFPLVQN